MAPFRASRSTRSGRPGGPSDHDIFDGLPVRQWKLQESLLGPGEELNGEAAKTAASNNGRPELPMPKGSEQYPPWSLQLLRAARSGKVLKAQNGAASHEPDNENGVEEARQEDVQRGTKRGAHNGFHATKWTQVPKHLEGPEREYVAKRRKGLQSTVPAANGNSTASVDFSQMRKTKVQRSDEEGLPQVLEVMVPEGKTVEGEIKDEAAPEIVAAPIATPAPGTVVQGLGVANEDGVVVATEGIVPLKKRPGPIIRKKKKNKGGKSISSTGGQGVSASAEAFNEQLRAQGNIVADGQGDAEDQKDTVMSGVGEGEEEDDEAGSEEDDEDGDDEEDEEEGEGDTTLQEGEQSHTPETNGEVTMELDNPLDAPPNVPESEAGQQSIEDQEAQLHDEVPMDTEEEDLPEPLLDGPYEVIEHEVSDQAQDQLQETAADEDESADELQRVEPPAELKNETLEEQTIKEEPIEQQPHKAEALGDDAPQEEMISNTKQEPQGDAPPSPEHKAEIRDTPPEDLHPAQEDIDHVEASNDMKMESIEEAAPLQQEPTEPEEPNDDSSDGPTRPSPEPLSPYSLSPVSKADRPASPGAAGKQPSLRDEPGPETRPEAQTEQLESANPQSPKGDIQPQVETTDRRLSHAESVKEAETLEMPRKISVSSAAPSDTTKMDIGHIVNTPPPPQGQTNDDHDCLSDGDLGRAGT